RCAPRGGDDDRWVAIAVRTQSEWERFVAALGSPSWASEPAFRTLYLRMRNRAELDAHVERWTRERSAEDAMNLLQRHKVAADVVSNGVDMCARDPQLAERGFWPAVKHPDGSPSQVTGVPFRMSGGSGSVRTIAPDVGENNDHVLGDILGLSRAERDALIASGAVWP
ncbi:MAG TPA: CoA transferase, partial [Candidatus Binataceae bacterium]|nr:CoA transferase [Candidatus Binataceae bacterium]